MFGILFLAAVGVVTGSGLFVTADYPFDKRAIAGLILYIGSWLVPMLIL